MDVQVPDIGEFLTRIADVQTTLDEETRTISYWHADYLRTVAVAREKAEIAIFNSFVNCLLERAMRGETWSRRMTVFERDFASLKDITPNRAMALMAEVGYRFPAAGQSVILDAKEVVSADDFSWPAYIAQAEQSYEDNFQQDPFLAIKGVAFKTRDLALSELSDRFVAVDLHVVRVTTRTGLLVCGYGDPRITTDVSYPRGYLFFHGLLLKLARETGWPDAGYSPGEIDRMFWHFGRAVCNARPSCETCPVSDICLTYAGT